MTSGSPRGTASVEAAGLSCAACGRPVTRRGASGLFAHRSRGAVAACDLDADHVAVPDWRAVGAVTCGVCGRPAAAGSANVLAHTDAAMDRDHAPDPWGAPTPGR